MPVLQWILNLVLFLASLGVLITIHELGHFMTAKLFKVYCIDFSIGFGPKFFKRKMKGGETTFSLGTIPLGGYVLMYGEGTELPSGVIIDESRSLEGIRKWKKAIILSAGIVLNMVLGMVLFLVSNTCLPYSLFGGETIIAENSTAYDAGIRTGDVIGYVSYTTSDNATLIIDSEVPFADGLADDMLDDDHTTNTYVLGYYPDKTTGDPIMDDGIALYAPQLDPDKIDAEFQAMIDEGLIKYVPDFEKAYAPIIDATFTASLAVYSPLEGGDGYSETPVFHSLTFTAVSAGENQGVKWNETGLAFTFDKVWRTFGQGLRSTWDDFAYANTAVFRGIGMLFTGSGEVSGIVGIFATSSSILADYGFATYLYLWGLISVNLAVFNLLPFPGLDGWQLLVTAIEGISHKKVPTKVKGIISAIGLVLLFGLMILITIKDVIGLF